jgi:hypothetical protein
MKAVKLSETEMRELHARALAAADQAFYDARPQPMIVYEPGDPVASLLGRDDGGLANARRVYEPVMDGACGFAWVTVRPGTSRFARWLVKHGIARSDSYYGGVSVWAPGGDPGSQSYERKMAAATAYAAVLSEAGITAYANGRLD